MLLTVVVAWACALWTPQHFEFNPKADPLKAVITPNPDGGQGLHYQAAGFGWDYIYLRGCKEASGFYWLGGHMMIYHRLVGWPFRALHSRVEVLDSQFWQRYLDEGEAIHERRRWELPYNEIIHRGLASKDLPTWIHAKQDRRLPLIPRLFGFVGSTVFYAIVCFGAVSLWRLSKRLSGDVASKLKP